MAVGSGQIALQPVQGAHPAEADRQSSPRVQPAGFFNQIPQQRQAFLVAAAGSGQVLHPPEQVSQSQGTANKIAPGVGGGAFIVQGAAKLQAFFQQAARLGQVLHVRAVLVLGARPLAGSCQELPVLILAGIPHQRTGQNLGCLEVH